MKFLEAVIVIAAVIALWWIVSSFVFAEGFATRQEKAHAISQWFERHPDPKYADYQNDIKGSNIVEFEQIRVSDKSIDSINKIV